MAIKGKNGCLSTSTCAYLYYFFSRRQLRSQQKVVNLRARAQSEDNRLLTTSLKTY